MLLGIISDTHGEVTTTRNAIRMFESLGVEHVVHCGDIGSAAIVDLFAGFKAYFVFGNVDHQRDYIRHAIEDNNQNCQERFGSLEIDGRKIAFLHGDDCNCLCETAQSQKWDLVCHGHTHMPHLSRRGKTLVLNPGAIVCATRSSIAIVDLSTMQATHVPL
ncbi:MAG: YfcE family phosphodiesterase [Planctomycetia bacterium]|jgi:putative phosphoesterase